ncbi:hypothetical protein PG995_007185 [Apiospora arundinis]|uniref:RanBP2-type domain-containing protein n=1 Tax=Apiospora arundinis TaxID=335852 RepID=A0ABR2JHF8_9PEZI
MSREQNSNRSSGSSRRHHASRNTEDVHIGQSQSRKKAAPQSNENVRWICGNCKAGNLSYTYDTSCPFCNQPRGHGATSYTV